jgi:hypothetical protein
MNLPSPGQGAATPGDPDWSTDGRTILFTNYPFSIMGSIPITPNR